MSGVPSCSLLTSSSDRSCSLVSPDQCLAPGACLVVSVFDRDKLKRDDFEGEAFLALKDVPGVTRVKEEDGACTQADVKAEQIRLRLMHPKPNGSECYTDTNTAVHRAAVTDVLE